MRDRDGQRHLLESLNAQLAQLPPPQSASPPQVVVVLGPPRGGTTLTYQILAATDGLAYPSNLVARFYRAPWIGEHIQQLMRPMLDVRPIGFTSTAGRTSSWNGPHEFGFFFDHHLGFTEHHEPDHPKVDALVRALGSWMTAAGRPLLLKNGLLTLVAPQLVAALVRGVFVRVHRNPSDVAQSILDARRSELGSVRRWWSVKPAHANEGWEPERQVARQLAAVRDALDVASALAPERFVEVGYPDLCRRPAEVVEQVSQHLGIPLSTSSLPESFVERTRSEPSDALRLALAEEGL